MMEANYLSYLFLQRNDMVEYFGEQIQGFSFLVNGWVQYYGSRCVKPLILYADVSRPKPMIFFWSKYAQSLTPRPMKGMPMLLMLSGKDVLDLLQANFPIIDMVEVGSFPQILELCSPIKCYIIPQSILNFLSLQFSYLGVHYFLSICS